MVGELGVCVCVCSMSVHGLWSLNKYPKGKFCTFTQMNWLYKC